MGFAEDMSIGRQQKNKSKRSKTTTRRDIDFGNGVATQYKRNIGIGRPVSEGTDFTDDIKDTD
ncbi:hypothetical protein [Clostridium perfringens]|uniref:hypothetical protein n=1 Tax=Clostridium perfringens TaxID=1502 RepID=UPI001A24B333|nr:hypothetical protein CPBEC5_00610 [Clostridium perfringens]HAT4315836.1 hypothetical protein [Clostridium perfringens]HCG3019771.1 hypothetical protein [Clostridium perfringens]